MIKRFRYAFAALLLVCLGALPSVSMALPQFGRSIIYFDANDNIIGNQILYCNNVREHAGNVDPANPYRAEFQFGCGDPYISCDVRGICVTVGHNTVDLIKYFTTATGRTRDNYCLDPTYPGGPFYGKVDCDLPEASELTTVLSGYTPGF